MTHTHVDPAFLEMLNGYGLATAHIFYQRPDFSILQEFIWQDYDLAPRFPRLVGFLDFWKRELAGPVKSVIVAHSKLITPREFKNVAAELRVH
jgi:uncharacterized protein Usg